jgi:hypothetical protein
MEGDYGGERNGEAPAAVERALVGRPLPIGVEQEANGSCRGCHGN